METENAGLSLAWDFDFPSHIGAGIPITMRLCWIPGHRTERSPTSGVLVYRTAMFKDSEDQICISDAKSRVFRELGLLQHEIDKACIAPGVLHLSDLPTKAPNHVKLANRLVIMDDDVQLGFPSLQEVSVTQDSQVRLVMEVEPRSYEERQPFFSRLIEATAHELGLKVTIDTNHTVTEGRVVFTVTVLDPSPE